MDTSGDLATPQAGPAAPDARHFSSRLLFRVVCLFWLETFLRFLVLALAAFGIWYVVRGLGAFIPSWPLGSWDLRLDGFIIGALAAALAVSPRGSAAARLLDERAGTADRLTTALAFSRKENLSPWEYATLRECVEYLGQLRPRRYLRLPGLGRPLALAAVLIALGGALHWAGPLEQRLTPDERAALQAEKERQGDVARKLEEAAAKLGEQPDPKAQELADKVRKAAKDLAAHQSPKAEELRAAALRQLAALETATRAELERRAQNAKLDPNEAKALAEALKASPDFAEAGKSLAEGKGSKAAQEIRDTLSRLNEQARKDAVDAVAAALSRQDPLTRPHPPKPADKNAAQKAMQALASQQSAESMKALQELAKMLEEMGLNLPGQNGDNQNGQGAQMQGMPMSKQNLAKLLQALQNLKNQARGGEGKPLLWPGDQDSGEGKENLIFMSSAGMDKQPGGDATFMTNPTGSPDTTQGMDSGTAEPLADKPFDAGHLNKSEALRLNSLLGEGESLLTLTPAAAPGTKAGTRYQDVLKAAEPAFQEALNREDIPLGSRELIKRYFEEIRP